MKRCTTVVVLGLLLALAGPATSQTENPEQDKAKLYYQLGEKYFREANYRAALEEFRKAHKLVPTPIMLWNFGRCLEGLGKAKEAAKQYEEYLRLDPRTKNRTIIERRIQNLRKQAGQSAAPPAEKKSPEPVSKPRAPAAVTVEPEPDQGINIKQVMGWTAAGVGVAAAVTGGVLLGMVGSKIGEYEDAYYVSHQPYDEARVHLDQAETFQAAGIAALVVGGVLAGAGTVLLVLSRRGNEQAGGVAGSEQPPWRWAVTGHGIAVEF